MPRQRMIQPQMWTDDGFLEMTYGARLLWIGMISHADDEGRGGGSVKSLKAAIFPGDPVSAGQMQKMKDEIAKHVRVRFYEIENQQYYQIEKWSEYQKISHPSPSTIPPEVTRKSQKRAIPEDSRIIPGKLPEASPQLVSELVSKIDRECQFPERSKLPERSPIGPSEMRAGAADLDRLKAGRPLSSFMAALEAGKVHG